MELNFQPTNRLVSILVVLLVVAVALAGTSGYLIGVSNRQTVTAMQTETATVTRTADSITFNYTSMPSNFTVGDYTVTMSQGTDYFYTIGNATRQYLGYYTVFNVTQKDGQTQTVPFFWGTSAQPSTAHPPYDGVCATEINCPYSASVFDGNVSIVWSEQNSTIYVTFTSK
jgi:hypothetical protein